MLLCNIDKPTSENRLGILSYRVLGEIFKNLNGVPDMLEMKHSVSVYIRVALIDIPLARKRWCCGQSD